MIYLDSCLVIYLTESRPESIGRLINAVTRSRDIRFAISPLVKMECLMGPFKRVDPLLRAEYTTSFAAFALLSMPEPVYLLAAQLRARFGLKTPDALHVACAQHHRCDALWTNDNRMETASHGLARRILK